MKRIIKKIPLVDFFVRIRDRLGDLKYIIIELYYHFCARFSRKIGITDHKRKPSIIVSLTTIPERIDKVYLCIESLLKQTVKPDHLILWLSESKENGRGTVNNGNIPVQLNRLRKRGLEIEFCRDIRSHRKIIYTLKENPDSVIVTADDDFFYPKDWLKVLYESYQVEPQYIHCHRAHLMVKTPDGKLKKYRDWKLRSPGIYEPSLLLFPTNGGGVLYPAGSLHKEVFNEAVFMRICQTCDDVWLKAMSLLKGIACKKAKPLCREPVLMRGVHSKALWKENLIKGKKDQMIKAVFERYNLYDLI